jgi:hypothetical protein
MSSTPDCHQLSLEENSAAALLEVAEELSTARDADHFLAALRTNHRIWTALSRFAGQGEWRLPDQRLLDYVVSTSRKGGRGVHDDDVEVLIGINRHLSAQLLAGLDPGTLRRRAVRAWSESARTKGIALDCWLADEIEREAG